MNDKPKAQHPTDVFLTTHRNHVIEECVNVFEDTIAEWANAEGISFDATTRLSNQLESAIQALKK